MAAALSDYPGPVVLDPVMIASSGAQLLEPAAVEALARLGELELSGRLRRSLDGRYVPVGAV